MSDTRVNTFYDLCELVRVSVGGGLAEREQEDIRLAVDRAYKSVVLSREWQFYERTLTIKPDAEQAGTISYDHAASGNVEAATNVTPIVITSRGHGLAHGRVVSVSGALGNTAANGIWTVRSVGLDTFQLVGSAGNGAYTSGGSWTANRQATFPITGGSSFNVGSWTNGTPLQVTSATPHGLATGDCILLYEATGRLAINGTWKITNIDATNFTLDGSVYDATLPVGGTCSKFDGSFASWAAYGRMQVGTDVGQIGQRLNDVCLSLDQDRNFGLDLSAESFTLFRSDYQLPIYFTHPRRVIGSDSFDLGYVDVAGTTFMERVVQTSGGPWHFTIMPDPHERGRKIIRLHGYPTETDLITIAYSGGPRRLKLTGYETRASQGTVSLAAGSPEITGVGTAFNQDMVGCILRTSVDTTKPTGLFGSTPYVEELEIALVGGTLKARSQPGTLPVEARSGVAYIVTDPLDAAETMIDALENESLRTLYKLRKDWESYGAMAKVCDESKAVAITRDGAVKHTGQQRGYGCGPNSDWLSTKRGSVVQS